MKIRSNGPSRRGDRLERVRLDDLDPLGDAGALEEVARLAGPRRVTLDRHDPPAAERLRHVQRRVADRGPDLEHERRVERPHERREEAAGLPVHDRDPLALGQLLHLTHDRRPLGPQVVEVAGDGVGEDRHRVEISRRLFHGVARGDPAWDRAFVAQVVVAEPPDEARLLDERHPEPR